MSADADDVLDLDERHRCLLCRRRWADPGFDLCTRCASVIAGGAP